MNRWKLGIVFSIMLFCSFGCSKAPDEGEYPRFIYVNDNLYREQYHIKRFSTEWILIGEIQEEIRGVPEQNFVSNSVDVGTKVYIDEKERIWIKVKNGQNKGKYIGYSIYKE